MQKKKKKNEILDICLVINITITIEKGNGYSYVMKYDFRF